MATSAAFDWRKASFGVCSVMPQKPGRTPPPLHGEEPAVKREKTAVAAHNALLRKAATRFARSAMAVQEATPGTIGHRAAERRARDARTVLEAAVALFVRRNRLDAHARSYRSAESAAEDALKHANLPVAHQAIVAPIVEQLVRSNRAMRELMQRQIAEIDAQVLRRE